MKIIGVIPARFASTRFPGKPLAEINGKPMIQWVYQGVLNSRLLSLVMVATDNEKIFETVKGFGGEAVMTPENCRSGSDRIARAIKDVDCEVVVNIQGDEPLITGTIVDEAVKALIDKPEAVVGTLCSPIIDDNENSDGNVVKVVFDKNGYALYFSRARIPVTGPAFKHIGIYVYNKDFLLKFPKMKRTELEKNERLEQLRILENGYKIGINTIHDQLFSVDTKQDLEKVNKIIKERNNGKS